jgi:glycosyltransferase involved in cell wall biosynthesis
MARICMLVHEHYPRDFRVRREAEALVSRGHEVQIISLRMPGERRRERLSGIDVLRLPIRRHRGSRLPVYLAEYVAFFALAAVALTALHLRRPFDLVHVHAPPDLLVFAAALPKLLRVPIVIDVHDRVPELYAERFSSSPAAIRALLRAEGAALRFATRVITVHDPYAERLARHVPAGRIHVVFNSADERLFPPIEEPDPIGPGRTPGPVRLLHHGTLMHRYGVDALIEAVARLDSAAVCLDVIGDGDLLPRLRRMVDEGRLQDRVRLHGYRPLEEMAAWIRQADLCIVPNRRSPFTDGILPTKLLEYVALGRPVIATQTDTVLRYFGEECVCYVPDADPEGLAGAIRSFIADPAPFHARSVRAARAYRRLRWAEQAERLGAIVGELTDGRGGQRRSGSRSADS